MQRVLVEWLKLDIGPCMGLNDLVLRPRAVYNRAINEAIIVPEQSGPFKLKPEQCLNIFNKHYLKKFILFRGIRTNHGAR
jgi:hypothetical protein